MRKWGIVRKVCVTVECLPSEYLQDKGQAPRWEFTHGGGSVTRSDFTHPIMRMKRLRLACVAACLPACASTEQRFALREPVWRDPDLDSVILPCRSQPTERDPRHVSCAPRPTELPEIWSGLDHIFFRPVSEALGVTVSGEAVNVNSLDEVPDSAWFTNRRHSRAASDSLLLGACVPSLLLDPDGSTDGSWIIDHGKEDGAALGFRVNVPGKGKYMFKADPASQPELQTAASVVGAAIYHAAGFNTACEQVVYFKPSLLKLTPGLHYRHNTVEDLMDFDQKALDRVLASCPRRGELVRMHASAWIPGYVLGPFNYDGTRIDDPSDVIPHENRRDLRGLRLLAAWTDNVDSRDANSADSWLADQGSVPDASPGHVVHYCMDFSHTLGPDFGALQRTEPLGYAYLYDWVDIAEDFLGLGIPRRPWFRPLGDPGYELFRNFDVHSFVPDDWKMQWGNPAYSRMTERDAAWMARILARFTPEQIREFARTAQFSDPKNTAHLADVLEGRLLRVLDRYLTRLSPIGELRVEGRNRLCGIDLAESRSVREPSRFRYAAGWSRGGTLLVEARGQGEICVLLPIVAADGKPVDDSPERYVRVRVDDGVAKAPLLAYLYDLGPSRGYVLAGVERPEP